MDVQPEDVAADALAPLIEMEGLRGWVVEENDDVLVMNKPGDIVCHPSKNGPMSSLVGACRVFTGLETLHLVSRLDRETSGLVVLAKHRGAARKLQMALQARRVEKTYHALLHGELAAPVEVDQPLAKDLETEVAARVTVRSSRSAQKAVTRFRPLVCAGGYTLAEVTPVTGRKHQIRAHAWWLGHGVVGDKIYGADDSLFLEFIERGWTPRLAAALPLRRQALHCSRLDFGEGFAFSAALPTEMVEFCFAQMHIAALPDGLRAATQ